MNYLQTQGNENSNQSNTPGLRYLQGCRRSCPMTGENPGVFILQLNEMKTDEYMEITAKLGECMSLLEDIEAVLIDKLGARCHSAVWIKLTSCFIVLSSLQFTQEYNHRFGNDQGNWSLTE